MAKKTTVTKKYVGGLVKVKYKKIKPPQTSKQLARAKAIRIKKGTFSKEQIDALNKQLNRFAYYQRKTLNTVTKFKKSLNILGLAEVLGGVSIKVKSRTELRNTLITYLYNNSNTVKNVTDAYLKNYDNNKIIKYTKQVLNFPRKSLLGIIKKAVLPGSVKERLRDQLKSLSDDDLSRVLENAAIDISEYAAFLGGI